MNWLAHNQENFHDESITSKVQPFLLFCRYSNSYFSKDLLRCNPASAIVETFLKQKLTIKEKYHFKIQSKQWLQFFRQGFNRKPHVFCSFKPFWSNLTKNIAVQLGLSLTTSEPWNTRETIHRTLSKRLCLILIHADFLNTRLFWETKEGDISRKHVEHSLKWHRQSVGSQKIGHNIESSLRVQNDSASLPKKIHTMILWPFGHSEKISWTQNYRWWWNKFSEYVFIT